MDGEKIGLLLPLTYWNVVVRFIPIALQTATTKAYCSIIHFFYSRWCIHMFNYASIIYYLAPVCKTYLEPFMLFWTTVSMIKLKINMYIYLDRYLCIFVVPRLPKKPQIDEVHVHKPNLGQSDWYLPINKKTVVIFYIVPLLNSNYLHNPYLIMLKKVNIVMRVKIFLFWFNIFLPFSI